MNGLEKVTLENIADGAAVELFDRELREVMKNINDKNTDSKAKRTISLKVSLSPNKDRSSCEIAISCTSSMAPVKSVDASILLGKEGSQLTAYKNYKQEDMFDNLSEFPNNN